MAVKPGCSLARVSPLTINYDLTWPNVLERVGHTSSEANTRRRFALVLVGVLWQKFFSANRMPSNVHPTANESSQLAHFTNIAAVRVGRIDKSRDLVELLAMTYNSFELHELPFIRRSRRLPRVNWPGSERVKGMHIGRPLPRSMCGNHGSFGGIGMGAHSG